MKKPALTISRNLLPSVEEGEVVCSAIPANLFMMPTVLADRVGDNSCEEDPSLQQIIPYLVVVNSREEVFTYTRGSAGAESKLVTKLSVGLGGHVDSQPPEGVSLHRWLIDEARRELQEEVGLTSDVQIVFDGLLFDRKYATLDDKVYVGQVHVGLLSFIQCEASDLKRMEEGTIENGTWSTLEQLREPETFLRLEPWSQLAVTELNNLLP